MSPSEILADRLDSARRYGAGYRAKCPACDDKHSALSFRDADDNRLLIHCFRGCEAADVLAAVRLSWADLQPARAWPPSLEEVRRDTKALREIAWAGALRTIALESTIALIAARELSDWAILSAEDTERLAVAVRRLQDAVPVLTTAKLWRPEAA
jgi:hypothetical protein